MLFLLESLGLVAPRPEQAGWTGSEAVRVGHGQPFVTLPARAPKDEEPSALRWAAGPGGPASTNGGTSRAGEHPGRDRASGVPEVRGGSCLGSFRQRRCRRPPSTMSGSPACEVGVHVVAASQAGSSRTRRLAIGVLPAGRTGLAGATRRDRGLVAPA